MVRRSLSSGIEQAHADETQLGSDINDDGSIDKWNITAETIGAYIDGQALAEKAYLVGRQGNFVGDRFFSWFGGTKLDATAAVREERFNALVTEINQEIGLPIVDSSVHIEDGTVSVANGSDGWSVDSPVFIDRFSASAFSPDNFSFVVPMKTDPMHIKPATAQKVADDVKAAIAENVTIVHDPDTWTLDTADLGELTANKFSRREVSSSATARRRSWPMARQFPITTLRLGLTRIQATSCRPTSIRRSSIAILSAS